MDEFEKALQERFLLQEEYLGDNKPVNESFPLVSVTVTTYQHVNYIRDCLNGILMQKTDFPYEIILGEDGSSDGTQEICKEYAVRYPDKIRLFIRDRRISQFVRKDGTVSRFNGIWNRMSARGKYIAWCEGDDYWTDPLKLQKQVNILESDKNIGFVYSKFQLVNLDNMLLKTLQLCQINYPTPKQDIYYPLYCAIIFHKLSLLCLRKNCWLISTNIIVMAMIGLSSFIYVESANRSS